jgi:hypothetical protein
MRNRIFKILTHKNTSLKDNIKFACKHILKMSGFEILRVPKYGKYYKRFRYFERIYDSIRSINGNIVECGVGKGNSFLTLVSLTQDESAGRDVWGFDSFEGFPEPSVHDKSIRNIKRGDLNVSTVDSIKKFLTHKGGIDYKFLNNHVKLVKGFFNESLKKYDGKPIAILHLDVDMHDSYKDCLEQLWPYVAPGGVVLFDEYKTRAASTYWPGAAKAIDEFFKDKKVFIRKDNFPGRYYAFKEHD